MTPNRAHSVPTRGLTEVPRGTTAKFGKFGRLYPHLPAADVPRDARMALATQMVEAVRPSADNPDVPAAYTFLAQFVNHDLTFDATTVSEAHIDPAAVWNFRTAALDLDSVYGAGPDVQPWLYDVDDPDLLQTGCILMMDDDIVNYIPGVQADLPRSFAGFALIADPRNDQNVMLAQLHLAFLHFHNAVVKWLRDNPDQRRSYGPTSLFQEARMLVSHHYQWVVLHDLLPRVVAAAERARVVKEGSTLAATGQAFLPVEFSVAAFRFGHSTIRPEYNINNFLPQATLDQLFQNTGSRRRPGSGSPKAPIDLTWIVDWRGLLGERAGIDNVQSRLIDPYLADKLARLDAPGPETSLPGMNLERGNSLGLPSGQRIARALGLPELTPEEISDGPDGEVVREQGLLNETPLWYYVLKEAAAGPDQGRRLGPVGGTIVADVIHGLLELDPNSILNQARDWTPTLKSEVAGTFTLKDLLSCAGVLWQAASRDWRTAPALNQPAGRTVLPEAYAASVRPR